MGAAASFLGSSRAEMFTSIAHLRFFQDTEKQAALGLAEYLEREQDWLQFYGAMLENMRALEDLGHDDDDRLVGKERLLLTYARITCLAGSWPRLVSQHVAASAASRQQLLEPPGTETSPWPTDEDLAGSAVGICRLQHTYGLSAQEMAELRSPLLNLTAHDRHEVARHCWDGDDAGSALGWWTSSLDALEEEGHEPTDNREAILDSMADISRRVQNESAAYRLLSALHDGAPTHVRDTLVEAVLDDEAVKNSEVAMDAMKFEKLCSSNRTGLERRSPTDRLRCTILHITGVGWLADEEHPLVFRVSAAVSAVTGMDVACAEDLQVGNYGVGGHYSPHPDYGEPEEPAETRDSVTGQRAATWLMYLSDVRRGGSTVFPELGLQVEAKAGRALFWINLLPEQKHGFHFEHRFKYGLLSEGDSRTTHGACPVLVGSKWIATKWIHELGQTRIPFDWPGGVH
ncbi:hypothetical protein HPB48_014636 [Haemaphysalis longicornis]|uniref:procollagen-proline 4-dioxygenase n=1 Tax=Haemaphysalis longicornis TaxID=44386 RepID=A0A9J6GMG1_HAELO|nr:hypothetical protein HPB48_014636 [Haemaphysalis longicornis]